MRDIRFRAWDKTNKKMFIFDELGINTEYNLLGFHWQGNHDYGDLELDQDNFELMQFTGLKDKNGKEIYEGDILKDDRGQYGKVLWHRNSYLVEWETRNNLEGHKDIERMTDDCFGYGEIAGNIYEHPELLK